MALLKVYKNGKLLLDECENANHFFTRFMGLMYRRSMEENHCLLLTPCNEIHTFGMKFDIDTIALSKDNEILFIDRAVPPKKVRKKVKDAYKVLELCSGTADKLGLDVGDVLEITDIIPMYLQKCNCALEYSSLNIYFGKWRINLWLITM